MFNSLKAELSFTYCVVRKCNVSVPSQRGSQKNKNNHMFETPQQNILKFRCEKSVNCTIPTTTRSYKCQHGKSPKTYLGFCQKFPSQPAYRNRPTCSYADVEVRRPHRSSQGFNLMLMRQPQPNPSLKQDNTRLGRTSSTTFKSWPQNPPV
mgnify:CR=1 FL=1